MSERSKAAVWRLSLDAWAVMAALALAAVIRLGIVKHVPW